MFLTSNNLTCLSNSLVFLFAVRSFISKLFLSFFKILIKVFPIEPVDPNITIFFFHLINN
tara:strand:+ start:90 stop:269 length:180 start_codon:yes stop_codon:yes gene_type:complete